MSFCEVGRTERPLKSSRKARCSRRDIYYYACPESLASLDTVNFLVYSVGS